MKYSKEEENELISLVCETNEDVRNALYEANENIIKYYVKKYTPIAKTLNIDPQDLYQEALIGFAHALNNFDDGKNASLKTFVSLCIQRRLIKFINKNKKIKEEYNQEILSLDYEYINTGLPLIEVLTDSEEDILEKFTKKEIIEEKEQELKKYLSSNETQVFNLIKEGLTYQEIAKRLDKSSKQIDNTIQRIKNKIKLMIKGEEK